MTAATLALAGLLALPLARADEPAPWPGGDRAALAWPAGAWQQALAATQQQHLGFASDQMQHYGRDTFITRPVAIAFRDARTTPRLSGKLSDDLLAAAKDPAALVRLGFALSDAVSARNFPRPEGAAWGVAWLGDDVAAHAALPLVLARMSPGLALDRDDEAAWERLPDAVQRLVVRALIGLVEGEPWIRLAFDDEFLARACGVERPSDLTRDALYRLANAPWADETDDQTATLSRASFEALRRTDRDYLGYGNDKYMFRSHCGGSGDLASIGLFWDRRGDDAYAWLPQDEAPPDGWHGVPPMGSATKYEPMQSFRDDLHAVGVFLDTGGSDAYPPGGEPAQGGTWTRHPGERSWGFGADLESFAGP